MRKGLTRITSLLITAVMIMTAFCSCSFYGAERFTVTYTDVFDTVVSFTAYCSSKEEFDGLCSVLHEELKRLDGIFNVYQADSEISLLNASGKAVVSDELLEVINTSGLYYDDTDGLFDITKGKLYSLWHDFRNGGKFPEKEELLSSAEGTGFDRLTINGNEVCFDPSKISLDAGAIVKGFAAKKLCGMIECENYILNLGGDVYANGLKNSGEKWNVGIENPDGGIILSVSVSDMSVATSGDYQRYAEKDGVRYHHIINGKTCYPSDLYRSVTVIHKDPETADALSTALFLTDRETGLSLAEKYGAEVFWINTDGSQYMTPGFSDYEKK